MSRRSPFSNTTPKKQDFSWRSGDSYQEQEYLKSEYKTALADYRLAEQELKSLQSKVTAASETLTEKDGYTAALADFLDGDTNGLTTEMELRQEIHLLERAISEHEKELERIQASSHPSVASGLQKEKAYYMLEIQQGKKSISNAYEEAMRAREQLAACSINNRYRNALQLEFELDKTQKKRKFLRTLVSNTKNTFDTRRPVAAAQNEDARNQRLMLQGGIDLKMAIARAEERQQRRRQKHAGQINFLLCQIEELNVRMDDIGIGDSKVQTESLRRKYFGAED